MIIIFGIRRLRKGMGPIRLRCANCGASPLVLFRMSTWFALFFIPMIPMSFKHYTACPNCKRVDPVSKADVERAQALDDAPGPSGPGAPAGLPGQPATLEGAVNQWASAGYGAPAPHLGAPIPPPQAPPGWFPDPAGSGGQRYWDGQAWTEHTAPTA